MLKSLSKPAFFQQDAGLEFFGIPDQPRVDHPGEGRPRGLKVPQYVVGTGEVVGADQTQEAIVHAWGSDADHLVDSAQFEQCYEKGIKCNTVRSGRQADVFHKHFEVNAELKIGITNTTNHLDHAKSLRNQRLKYV